ncbi:MAG TPA: hypothetical protein PLO33_17560 [Kouleothrix sp.]|uniref:hypothetical protein n=1 Tax=Kouleothrix sp. TaxID=2779161 RepID=UPI002C7CE555|nr:hypothetical protein [Kouleothrix sp.]HRC77495.1 hypothetical protein [Kouleothrix sp.]
MPTAARTRSRRTCLAYSLRTQSYVCMRRAELFEPLGIAAGVPSTLDILCGILSSWSRYDEALALLQHINELATA